MDRLLPNGESPDHTMLGWKCKFTKEEDDKLKNLVENYPKLSWKDISVMMGSRTPRQCRERWQNALCNKIVKSNWTPEEDQLILQKFNEIGPHWKHMESFFNGRVSYDIRNRCHSLLKRQQLINQNNQMHAEETALPDPQSNQIFTGESANNDQKSLSLDDCMFDVALDEDQFWTEFQKFLI